MLMYQKELIWGSLLGRFLGVFFKFRSYGTHFTFQDVSLQKEKINKLNMYVYWGKKKTFKLQILSL